MYFPFAIRFVILSKNSSLALAPASESSHSFAYAASLLQAGKAFRYHLFFHSCHSLSFGFEKGTQTSALGTGQS